MEGQERQQGGKAASDEQGTGGCWVRGWLWGSLAAPEVPGTLCPRAGSESSQGFIKAKNYPESTSVETENDGSESSVFRQLFQKWTVPNQTSGLGKTHTVGKVGECPLLILQHSLDWDGGAGCGDPHSPAGCGSALCPSPQPR